MSKSLKTKRNKVPKIGDKEYAEYINFLKISDGEAVDASVDNLQSNTKNSAEISEGLELLDGKKKD